MKCINCGFDSNDTFCPMCGAKLPEQVNTMPNGDTVGVVSGEDEPTAYYVSNNPYENVQQSEPAPQQTPVQPPQGGMPTPPPYAPQPQGMPTPPPYAPQPQGMPTPPPYMPPQPKKQSRTFLIVLSIVVIAVIVIGTVINVVSSIAYKESILDIFNDTYDSYDDDYYAEPYYGDYETDEDSTPHPMNEASKFKYGTVTLTNIEITKDKFLFDDSICECAFTFEIENTSDDEIVFSVPFIEIYSAEDKYYEDYYEWMYDDFEASGTYNDSIKIGAGEKKTFITYYKVPTEAKEFNITFNLFDYYSTYDFYCYFNAQLPENAAVSATEPTTKKAN